MKRWLWQPVDIASLVFFRVVFGILGFADLMGGFAYYHLWVDAFNPENFQFRYYGFEWVTVFPEPLMSLFFLIGMGLAIAVALGWRYRITAPLFACFFTYYFLLEKAHYLNHGYLFCWLSWVMAVLPAWRAWSVDVWRKPAEYMASVPRWTWAILPFLMGVVYFFGGIAKLNADWLLAAMPLKLWLKSKADLFLIGPLLAKESTAWIMAWTGAVFDLSIAFLMLNKRTWKFGFAFAVAFHLTNHLVFNIGIFPYLSVALTALFFPPDWPRKFVDFVRLRWTKAEKWYLSWQLQLKDIHSAPRAYWQAKPQWQNGLMIIFGLLICLHCALPLRHWLYASEVAWSEEGHRYAWRMMLRAKRGSGHFVVKNLASGEEERVNPRKELSAKQARKLWTHPDMILQYAHHLRDQALAEGDNVAIFAKVKVKLNDGQYHPYIDPEVDLAKIEWSFWAASPWILPEN
ncbi:MAG: HTTM domain-containing protein [Lewinella sp.]|jgi:hypothetical protein|uniref:HTTM domain-containing protein n=1 Tax=Lewinella sp. TaxID=2004506 RepID=UPI003D6A0EE9